MPQLKQQVALVTGGTSGIGKAIALKFAEEGASVIIFGTHLERALEVVSEMEKRGSSDQKFGFKLLNIADKKSVDEAILEVLSEMKTVDILVNNAGITKDTLLMKMTEQDWDSVINVNLKSVYNTSQALIRQMLKAKRGKIINISSVVGLMGNAGQTNYAASKSGMIGMTKSLAKEVASRGICVNCIAPGFIETSMTDELTKDQKQAIFKEIPLNRFGSPEEIAHAALFLASSMSNYITGQVLTVDGGMVM
ncbi:MAG: 3-oxoacyl-ACP reductase FabG [Candidatus Rhabdochlamydia sp.]